MKLQSLYYRARQRFVRQLSGETIDAHKIATLFFPILLEQMFIIGLGMVNTALISSSGVAAISAVSTVDTLNLFLLSVFIAIAAGGTVIVAQYKGQRNEQMVARASAATVTAVTVSALLVAGAAGLFHTELLGLMLGKGSPEVVEHAELYLLGSLFSYVGIAVVQGVNAAMRGMGKAQVSLGLTLIMNLSYVLLNVLFIVGLDMGVLGMVIAINIARYGAAICAIFYVLRMDTSLHLRLRDLLVLPMNMLKKMMYIGLPFAAEQLFFHGGKIITQLFVVQLGTYAIATNAISGAFAMIFQIPAIALQLTLVTVVGQSIGARNVADARKFTRTFMWLGCGSFVVMTAIMLPLFYPLIQLFHPPEEIIQTIFWITLINAVMQIPFWSASFLLPAGLRAAGDSRFTSITAMLTMWLFRIVLGYILGIMLNMGVLGIWLAMNLEWGIRGAIFYWRFKGEKWYAHKLV